MYFLAFLLLAFGAFNVVQSEECKQALGMESRAITDGQISASSQFSSRNAAAKARLNYQGTPGAWSPAANDKRPWLQIDLKSHVTKVTRVATQGRRDSYQWVTKYQLQYSSDGENFVNYKEKGDTEATSFPGNTDRTTVVHHDLNPPIRARYIRFLPVARRSWPSMRVELYGCKEKFQCPVCHAIGQNAEATCDKNVKYETCNRHNAVCQLSKKATTDDKTLEVTRKCSDTQTFRDENEKCKQDSNCLYTAYCLDSMCMASAPVAFQCPTCSIALGWEAECADRPVYKVCTKSNPACFVTQQLKGTRIDIFRGCGSDTDYAQAKANCHRGPQNCLLIGKCKETQCMAPYPAYCGELQKILLGANIFTNRFVFPLWIKFCV